MMPGTLVSIYIWNAILHYDRCDVIMDDIIKQQWCTIMWQLWFHDGIVVLSMLVYFIYILDNIKIGHKKPMNSKW